MIDRIAATFLAAPVALLACVLRASRTNVHMMRLALKRGRALPLRHLIVWAEQMEPRPSKEELWDHVAHRLGTSARVRRRKSKPKKDTE